MKHIIKIMDLFHEDTLFYQKLCSKKYLTNEGVKLLADQVDKRLKELNKIRDELK